jgi:pimeloyl-ACP methyl ester carboxylesterase
MPLASRLLFVCAALAGLLAGAGCLSPARQFSERAAELGLQGDVVVGSPFLHVVFQRPPWRADTLHVYIDGDGTPWQDGQPASDPTPREPLLLRLMALDPHPSLYLGRPCYHGLSRTPPCTEILWTDQRYSEAVVSSMAAALRGVLEERGVARVIWFGYSGGGTLAMLLAPRIAQTVGLVTVAGNLDIDAWADLHGYPPLAGSLNPATHPPIPPQIYQRHYVGDVDPVVPSPIVARGPIDPATLIVIPSYDHRCCWVDRWPAILAEAEQGTRPGDR